MRLFPDRISGQLFALVVMMVVAFNVIMTLIWVLSEPGFQNHPAERIGRLAALVELIDGTPPARRPELLATMARSHPDYVLRMVDAAPGEPAAVAAKNPSPEERPRPRPEPLARALGERFTLRGADQPGAPDRTAPIEVVLPDGSILSVARSATDRPPPRLIPGPLYASIVAVLSGLVIVGIWGSLALTRPLRALAKAAEGYDPAGGSVVFPDDGPREIRKLAGALGRMQERIAQLMRERSNAFAALGHDLRTPITRLRLRADYMPDETERARMVDDLDLMDRLVHHTLDHLRSEASLGTREPLDLASLIQTVVDRFDDLGQVVPFESAARVQVRGDPIALERAIGNLVENACKYGGEATIRLTRRGPDAIIEISDRGPGIPAAQRDRLREPYVRGDVARRLEAQDGFGLGLAIADTIVKRHGGRLELDDAVPHGLVARIVLPVA